MGLKRILVTGAGGMLGQELIAYLSAKGYEVTGTTSSELNLLQTMEAMREVIEKAAPEIIVHAAAYTNVDGAETNPDLAMAVNKDGTRKLALIARDLGIIFALISTDYVFDGELNRPYSVKDKPNPINAYGLSKYYGELMVTELLDEYYIIRTSWLYGIHGKNFVQFVLDTAAQGRELKVITDQTGSPTWTGSLCNLIENIIISGAYGTYHASDSGGVTRFEQARRICEAAGLSTGHIRPVTTRELAQPALRPRYTVLDNGELPVASWETALHAYLEQYLNNANA